MCIRKDPHTFFWNNIESPYGGFRSLPLATHWVASGVILKISYTGMRGPTTKLQIDGMIHNTSWWQPLGNFGGNMSFESLHQRNLFIGASTACSGFVGNKIATKIGSLFRESLFTGIADRNGDFCFWSSAIAFAKYGNCLSPNRISLRWGMVDTLAFLKKWLPRTTSKSSMATARKFIPPSNCLAKG